MSTFGNEDVRRLDIPMNDTGRVRHIQRVCDLNRKRQEQICLQRTPGDAMLQHDAVQKLHGNESLAILLPDVVDRANIRMIQRGCGLRLPLETSQGLSVSGNLLRQKLESD